MVVLFLSTASSGLFATGFLDAGENRLGVFGLLMGGTSGRRFSKENGTEDLVPGSLDGACLGRKLKGRKFTEGASVLDNSSSISGSSSSNGSKSEAGAAVVASFGKTEVGFKLAVDPGNTEDREPRNLNPPGLLAPGKAPGLLAPKRNPGELPLTLDELKRPGREEPLAPPGLDDWKRKRTEDGTMESRVVVAVVSKNPKRKGRLAVAVVESSSSAAASAGVAVTVGVRPSRVIVAERKFVRLKKGKISGRRREPLGRTGKLLRLVGLDLGFETVVGEASSGSSVIVSDGRDSVAMSNGVVPVASSCSDDCSVGVANNAGISTSSSVARSTVGSKSSVTAVLGRKKEGNVGEASLSSKMGRTPEVGGITKLVVD